MLSVVALPVITTGMMIVPVYQLLSVLPSELDLGEIAEFEVTQAESTRWRLRGEGLAKPVWLSHQSAAMSLAEHAQRVTGKRTMVVRLVNHTADRPKRRRPMVLLFLRPVGDKRGSWRIVYGSGGESDFRSHDAASATIGILGTQHSFVQLIEHNEVDKLHKIYWCVRGKWSVQPVVTPPKYKH